MNTPVSFEIAKALKEKGYNTIDSKAKLASIDVRNNKTLFFTYYMCNGDGDTTLEETGTNSSNFNGLLKDYTGTLSEGNLYRWYLAPTIAEVIMWIYEEHGRWIEVRHIKTFGINRFYIVIWKYEDTSDYITIYHDDIGPGYKVWDTPAEAYAAAIEYTLNNLILQSININLK